MCAGNAVFSHTKVVSESKIVHEMLCFTKETAVGGCEGRRCETAGAAMVANGRPCSPTGKCRESLVMVVPSWFWVVGLWRCARGKCIQRVANHIVMVVSSGWWVCGPVLGGSACKELQIAL